MRIEAQDLSKQFQVFRRREVRPDIGGELDDLAEGTFDTEDALGLLIREQKRQGQKEGADS
ncbi:MAG TPA: hypothetical protein VL919_11135, partial [Vicinamibacterales bacterium]|nr:hypothetical protein [Vicinamibacterales bacterium]